MPAAPFHAKIADLPRESIADGVLTRTAVRTDDAIVTFNWIQPGHPEVPPHSHPYDQLALILAGTLELDLDGDKYTSARVSSSTYPRAFLTSDASSATRSS